MMSCSRTIADRLVLVNNMRSHVALVLLLSSFIIIECKQSEFYRLEKTNGGFRAIRFLPGDDSADSAADRFRMKARSDEEARCLYHPLINETGWSFLECHSEANKSNEAQVYAVGFLEGAITADIIYMHWYNTLGDFCQGLKRKEMCSKIDEYVTLNFNWIINMTETLGDTDEYWHSVKLFYMQLKGLADGYKYGNKDPSKNLTFKDLLWLNLQGDFEDLTEAFTTKMPNFNQNNYLPKSAKGLGHCSALIKVLQDGSELFVAQDTWSSYQSMLRLEKKYIMSLQKIPSTNENSEKVAGNAMSFSSYPGVITSGDDFYVISSGLTTLETTIGNGNASLWQYLQPVGQVFEGVRAMVANRLASDGETWTKIFSKYNSGTYNNQWMIVDYNKFLPFKGGPIQNLPDGLLWVLEQIPNNIEAADMTDVLRKTSYWPSYNVAYFPKIFKLSGNEEMVRKFGDWFTYEKNPRARIFKRDHGKVKDTLTMLELMRYNDYKHDPLSACDCNPPYSAENTISARCDLNPANGVYPFPALGHRQHGATDAKITSSDMFKNNLTFLAVSGPVFNESLGIPPFQWSKSDFEARTPHLGHPDKWTFDPIMFQWAK